MDVRILVAEDEPNLRKLIRTYLNREGFIVTEASNGREAVDRFYEGKFSLVLLDIMMPLMDGLAVCREIRKSSEVPVVMLTARSQEYDEIGGFACGADEYVTKPFSPAILIARIKAVLRRTGGIDQEKTELAGVTIFGKEKRVESDGIRIDLTPKEYELLEYLMRNRNIALSRETLITNVWGYDYDGDDRTVDTHIKCLRSKLMKNGRAIRTIRKVGYMFSENTNNSGEGPKP